MKNTLIILICFISVNFFGQKRELGKVTVDELKQKNHSTDSSAVAAIMFKVGDVIFDYTQQDCLFGYIFGVIRVVVIFPFNELVAGLI